MKTLPLLFLLAFALTAEAAPKTECPVCQKQGLESSIQSRMTFIGMTPFTRCRREETLSCTRKHFWIVRRHHDGTTERTNGKLAK